MVVGEVVVCNMRHRVSLPFVKIAGRIIIIVVVVVMAVLLDVIVDLDCGVFAMDFLASDATRE